MNPSPPPQTWAERRAPIDRCRGDSGLRRRWRLLTNRIEWALEWTVHRIRSSAVTDLLQLSGAFTLFVVVWQWWAEADDRERKWLYDTWGVVAQAEGKRAHGARNKALEDLAARNFPLTGLSLSRALLEGIDLRGANLWEAQLDSTNLRRANLNGARLRRANLKMADLSWANLKEADLDGAVLQWANLNGAVLSKASLDGASLTGADLKKADLRGADLRGADLSAANLSEADLREADLDGIRGWRQIRDLSGALVGGARSTPPGFFAWADSMGAITNPGG